MWNRRIRIVNSNRPIVFVFTVTCFSHSGIQNIATSIFAIISAISYFVFPIDAIPDFIPVVGLLDDTAVVSLALHLVSKDLDDYMDWRLQVGLDKAEPIKD